MKTGRPPKAEKDKRTVRLTLLLTKAEQRALKSAAAAQGQSEMSAWARAILLDAATRPA